MSINLIGLINDSDVYIFSDETLTEFYVKRGDQVIALPWGRFKAIYFQNGISWHNVAAGVELEKVILSESEIVNSHHYNSTSEELGGDYDERGNEITDESYGSYNATYSEPKHIEVVAIEELSEVEKIKNQYISVFDGSNNIYLGLLNFRNEQYPLGFQNDTGLFFYIDESKGKLEELTEEVIKSSIKRKNAITWINDYIKEQTTDMVMPNKKKYSSEKVNIRQIIFLMIITFVFGLGFLGVGGYMSWADVSQSAGERLFSPWNFLLILGVPLMLASMLLSMWGVYMRAGIAGWKALIPVYSYVAVAQEFEKPIWWAFMTLVPVVQFYFIFKLLHEISNRLGHGVGFTLGLLLLPMIFNPIATIMPPK